MHHEEIADNIFRIEVPLPDTPLKITNSYCIRGERNLVIDTGFNHEQCLDAMRNAYADLHLDPDQTDLFITHMHADHCGLIRHLAGSSSRIYMSRADGLVAENCQSPVFWNGMVQFFTFTGLTAYGFSDDVACHPGFSWAPEAGADITIVEDGDTVQAGQYSFRCIATPGHTQGHMCLFEPEHGMLFSGDHILGRITPNITLTLPQQDVLAQYLASLDKVSALPVRIVYPGHRQRIDDCQARIAELQKHHQHRLDEVLDILTNRSLTTVQVTREMRWSLTYRNWEDYPPAQKLFSTGEGFAHLYHLAATGKAGMEMQNGVYYFTRR